MTKDEKTGKLVGCGLIIILVAFFYLKSTKDYSDERDKILQNYQIVLGTALEYSNDGAKHGSSLKYKFIYNHNSYYSSTSGNSFWGDRYFDIRLSIVNKSFPVILSVKEPTCNTMLITPEDFDFYHLPFPDSLKWVKEVLDK